MGLRATTLILPVMSAFALVACAAERPSDSPSIPPSPSPVALSPAPTIPSIGSITLDIGAGADAGSHSIDLPLAACLSQGDAWRIEARDEGAAGLSQVVLLGYPPVAGSQRFTLLAVIGPVMETASRVYILRVADPDASNGTGSLTIEDQAGGGATLRVVGSTFADVALTLTVECGSVIRPPAETEP